MLMACVGVGFPYLYAANILILIFFLFRRSRHWKWSLLSMLVGLPALLNLVAFNKNHNACDNREEKLKIVSFNVKNLSNSNFEHNNAAVTARIYDYLDKTDADVILLQEFFFPGEDKNASIAELEALTATKYHCYTNYFNGQRNSILTLSKHQLINVESLRRDNKSYAVICDMVKGSDTIRIFNVHLQSLHLNMEDYSNIPQTSDDVKSKAGKLYSNLSTAFKEREMQVEVLQNMINDSPYRIVLAGDLNDTPTSHTYRTLTKILNDTFKEVGSGFGFTFRDIPLMRIDYMFHSENIESQSFIIEKHKGMSDHDAIVGTFCI